MKQVAKTSTAWEKVNAQVLFDTEHSKGSTFPRHTHSMVRVKEGKLEKEEEQGGSGMKMKQLSLSEFGALRGHGLVWRRNYGSRF